MNASVRLINKYKIPLAILVGNLNMILSKRVYLEAETSEAPKNKAHNLNLKEIEKIDNHEYWEDKARHCSFCRYFMHTPCINKFKRWSNCIEQANEMGLDVVEACADYSAILFECTDMIGAFKSEPKTEEENEEEGEEGQ
jgi:hypothetical protein